MLAWAAGFRVGGGLGDLVEEELVRLLEVRAKLVIQFVDHLSLLIGRRLQDDLLPGLLLIQDSKCAGIRYDDGFRIYGDEASR